MGFWLCGIAPCGTLIGLASIRPESGLSRKANLWGRSSRKAGLLNAEVAETQSAQRRNRYERKSVGRGQCGPGGRPGDHPGDPDVPSRLLGALWVSARSAFERRPRPAPADGVACRNTAVSYIRCRLIERLWGQPSLACPVARGQARQWPAMTVLLAGGAKMKLRCKTLKPVNGMNVISLDSACRSRPPGLRPGFRNHPIHPVYH
jgi:hypothetical protein